MQAASRVEAQKPRCGSSRARLCHQCFFSSLNCRAPGGWSTSGHPGPFHRDRTSSPCKDLQDELSCSHRLMPSDSVVIRFHLFKANSLRLEVLQTNLSSYAVSLTPKVRATVRTMVWWVSLLFSLFACRHTSLFQHVGRRYNQHFPELRDPPASASRVLRR